jgi:uracil-DNA glycosylase
MKPKAPLAAFQADLRQCRRCLEAGHPIIPGPVFSGASGAQIMLIGQAPGVTEAVVKRPFNASAGKRLFLWLAQAGVEEADFRATQYMTSVTKCFPGKAARSGGDRVPSKAEQALCRDWLEREISLINPRLIIPVGRLAIGLFLPYTQLGEVIGKRFERDGRAIIALPHPSGASTWHHAPAHKLLLSQALALVAREHQVLRGADACNMGSGREPSSEG